MQQILEAIYENGTFRPLKVPQLAEGEMVQLVVHSQPAITPDDILAIAASVYEGLSEDEICEVEQIAYDRTNFMKPEIGG
jgi:predicted DNA-binding antitoxin AbrB/MazE fold protein